MHAEKRKDPLSKTWAQETIRRYQIFPDHQRPPAYFIASDETSRSKVNDWLLFLPDNRLSRAILDLRDKRKGRHLIHELLVGSWLKNRGYHIEYEPKIHGLTPDWLATRSLETAIVEVLTADANSTLKSNWDMLLDLQYRVSHISGKGAILSANLRGVREQLSQDRIRDATKELGKWLSANPNVGDRFMHGSLEFELEDKNVGDEIHLIGPMTPFYGPNPDSVEESIRDKVRKYRYCNRPLVVAVIVAPLKDLTKIEVKNISDYLFNREDQKPLSAIMWYPQNEPHPTIQFNHNPNAHFPLSAAFSEKA